MKNPHAVALGSIRSARKAKSSILNGKLGGRPKMLKPCTAKRHRYTNGKCSNCGLVK